MKKIDLLSFLYAIDIWNGKMTLDDVPNELIKLTTLGIIHEKQFISLVLAYKVLNDEETLDTIPVLLREDVQSILEKYNSYKVLYLSEVINGTMQIEELPKSLQDDIDNELK